MFLISKLLQVAQAWRSNRNRSKNGRRSSIGIEQLDHRQLLSINFTGNVATDFLATEQPGVVIFNSSTTPNIQHPIIPPNLQPYIHVSGFDISEIRVSYDSAADTLFVGFNQPPSGNPGQPGSVMAGDADDNGNVGSVNPAVEAAAPGFTEFPALGGPEEMAAYLDFNGTGVPQVVAGFSPVPPPSTPTDPSPPKPYQVALAIPNEFNPQGVPSFGSVLANNIGNVYLFNSPAHPNLEFSITHFSQLYQEIEGKPLTSSSVISIGAFAGSPDDIGISDAFFPASSFTLASATEPATVSPTIFINPHEHRIIDTHHRDLVRVSIIGTSGFPVSQIEPSTVELDGVHAIAHITRKIKRDEFPFATYVFLADQLNLPAGLTTATLTGQTTSGTLFQSQRDVLNITDSARAFGRLRKYMGDASFYKALAKVEVRNPATVISVSSTPVTAVSRNPAARGIAKIKVDYTPSVTPARGDARLEAEKLKVRPVVAIQRAEVPAERTKVPTRLRHSMDDFLS